MRPPAQKAPRRRFLWPRGQQGSRFPPSRPKPKQAEFQCSPIIRAGRFRRCPFAAPHKQRAAQPPPARSRPHMRARQCRIPPPNAAHRNRSPRGSKDTPQAPCPSQRFQGKSSNAAPCGAAFSTQTCTFSSPYCRGTPSKTRRPHPRPQSPACPRRTYR